MKKILIVTVCLLFSTVFLFGQIEIPDRSLLHKIEERRYPHISPYILYEDSLHLFDAKKYIIDMWVDIPNDTIWANFKGIVESKSDTLSKLKVHLVGFTIDSIIVRGSKTTFSRPDSQLVIDLPNIVPTGDTVAYTVLYHGEPDVGGGLFGGGLTINDTITYVDCEPYGAKRWIPLYDLPSDKAYLETIIHVPNGYKVISNGVLVDSTVSGPWWMFHWQENHTIANYLIVFAASNQFATLRDTFNYSTYTMPIYHWVSREDSALMETKFERTADMLEWFSDTYGLYPFIDEKYSHVSAPIGGAMEDQTNTFFNTDANWGSDWDWVIAHELAHQWWGDWVTCGTWKDIWLNEGFATFSEAHYYWHREGPQAYHYYMLNYIMNYYINYAPYPPYPIYDPDYLFSVVTYEKGGSVLHMLRHIIGDSLFFESLREYGTTYGEGSAVTSEFIAKVEEVTGMDLFWFFDEWIYKPGHPEYEYGWWADTLSADSFRINLQVSQVQSHSWGVPTFVMPIDIYVPESDGDTLKTVIDDSLDYQEFTFYTDADPIDLMFDPGNWVLKEATEVPAGVEEEIAYEENIKLSIFPNPTRCSIRILFKMEKDKPYDVHIFDIAGREVTKFVNRNGKTIWDLKDRRGERVRKGVYFIHCKKGNTKLASSKVILF